MCLDIPHQTEEDIWVRRTKDVHLDGRFCTWVTSLLPERHSCRLDGGFLNGSYNLCQQLITNNGTAILLRLPRISSVSPARKWLWKWKLLI
jgi:hypothetical protein